jgi:prophage regulatory protein
MTTCFIDKKKLCSKVSLSARTIDAKEKAGEFPKRFTLSARKVVWDEGEVEAWMARKKEAAGKASVPQGCSPLGRSSPAVNHV